MPTEINKKKILNISDSVGHIITETTQRYLWTESKRNRSTVEE